MSDGVTSLGLSLAAIGAAWQLAIRLHPTFWQDVKAQLWGLIGTLAFAIASWLMLGLLVYSSSK